MNSIFDFCVIRETCNDINVIREPTTSAGNSFVVFIHLLSPKVISSNGDLKRVMQMYYNAVNDQMLSVLIMPGLSKKA